MLLDGSDDKGESETRDDEALEKKSVNRSDLLDSGGERRCTVFACFPWKCKEERGFGVVLKVPHIILELLCRASQHFGCTYTHVVNEDMGEILDIELIRDLDKVFVVNKIFDCKDCC